MYKVGDKVAIKFDNILLFLHDQISRTLTIEEKLCKFGEVFTITDIFGSMDMIHISNSRGFTYVYENEIETLRKYKLKRVMYKVGDKVRVLEDVIFIGELTMFKVYKDDIVTIVEIIYKMGYIGPMYKVSSKKYPKHNGHTQSITSLRKDKLKRVLKWQC